MRPGRRTRKRRALQAAAHDLGDLAFCMSQVPVRKPGGQWCTRGGFWIKWPDGRRSRAALPGYVPPFVRDRQRAGIDRSEGSLRARHLLLLRSLRRAALKWAAARKVAR